MRVVARHPHPASAPEKPPWRRANERVAAIRLLSNDSPVDFTIVVELCRALLAPILSAALKAVNRRRESRAAALLILGALRDALVRTHATQLHPFRPVVVPFDSYAGVWEAERRALAHSMPPNELDVIEQAFAALSTLQKNEALGGDLREEVFDGLYDAGQQCEFARRIAWKHAQTPRSRVQRWIKLRARRLQERRDYWKLGRAVVKARKQASCPAFS